MSGRDLVLANNVRDIPEESRAWLPRIVVWWESQASVLGNAARQESRACRITRTDTGTRRDTRRVLVRNNMIHDPARITSRINNRRGRPRGGSSYAWVAQGDLEEAANRAWDAQAEAEVATTQVAQARTELEAARQSNRELLARTRELERHVFGAPQAQLNLASRWRGLRVARAARSTLRCRRVRRRRDSGSVILLRRPT
ncbi:hypothetical protein PF003_g1745 [Phytophthora fragariae]|nr:hypothetical protein PF003_g1745 [Phytophthora fragariae]